MNTPTVIGQSLEAAVAAEYLDLANVLEAASQSFWDAPSLCSGWRTREVIAHLTMPLRHGLERFLDELSKARGDFNLSADRVAKQDGAVLTPEQLLAGLRDHQLHAWQPPGGGFEGALTHVAIHGLDVTLPLGLERRVPEDRIRKVLEVAVSLDGLRANVAGLELHATDLEWTFGSGSPVSGLAQDLALLLFGRKLPTQRVGRRAAA